MHFPEPLLYVISMQLVEALCGHPNRFKMSLPVGFCDDKKYAYLM